MRACRMTLVMLVLVILEASSRVCACAQPILWCVLM
jgi:hypothetical protein